MTKICSGTTKRGTACKNKVRNGIFCRHHLSQEKTIKTQCVKIAELRKVYGPKINLEKWCNMTDNLLCCRNGRVFIYPPGKDKYVFHYPKSKWCNPYIVGKDGTIDKVLQNFEKHVLKNLKNDLGELHGKTLGCFCNQNGQCHVKILQRLALEHR